MNHSGQSQDSLTDKCAVFHSGALIFSNMFFLKRDITVFFFYVCHINTMTLAKINTVAPPKRTLSHQMGFFIHLDCFGVVVFLKHQLLIAGGKKILVLRNQRLV